jgi:hypothetical protein
MTDGTAAGGRFTVGAVSPEQVFVLLSGLAVAGAGSAIINDWRGAAVVWTRFDELFPPVLRTPAPFAGAALYALGATMSLLPLT